MTWMSRGLKAELSQYLGSSFLECCEGDLQVNFSSVQFSRSVVSDSATP